MIGRERTLNAMKGKPVDHVPVTFYAHQPDAEAHIRWVIEAAKDLEKT